MPSSAVVTPLDEIPAERISEQDFVVFGGSFDPIHLGHVGVIKRLLSRFREVVVAPTPQNPWKDIIPAPVEVRIEMIRAVLEYEKLGAIGLFKPIRSTSSPVVSIEQFPYIYSIELVRHLQGMTGRQFWWAVGADSAIEVDKWRDWKEHGVPVVSLPVEIDLHSIAIREGTEKMHPAALEVALKSGCYPGL